MFDGTGGAVPFAVHGTTSISGLAHVRPSLELATHTLTLAQKRTEDADAHA